MNVLLHFLMNYAIIDVVFGNARQYLLLILFFSVVLDIDHIPYTLRTRKELIRKKFGSECRTRMHEIYGITLVAAGLSVAYFFFETMAVQIAAISLMLHYMADFILGKSRPFYPFSKIEVFIGCPDKVRIPFEIVMTLTLGWYLWMSIA